MLSCAKSNDENVPKNVPTQMLKHLPRGFCINKVSNSTHQCFSSILQKALFRWRTEVAIHFMAGHQPCLEHNLPFNHILAIFCSTFLNSYTISQVDVKVNSDNNKINIAAL